MERKDIIRKVGSQFILYSHAGKRLGSFKSRKQAEAREQEINYFKQREKKK